MAKQLNVELLEKVKAQVLKEPTSIDMGIFIKRPNEICGTVACVAGWACILSGMTPQQVFELDEVSSLWAVDDKATELLGLTERQGEKLFYTFPEDDDVDIEPGTPEYAAAVAANIDEFIKDVSG